MKNFISITMFILCFISSASSQDYSSKEWTKEGIAFDKWLKTDKSISDGYWIPIGTPLCVNPKRVNMLHNKIMQGGYTYGWLKNNQCREIRGGTPSRILETDGISVKVEYRKIYFVGRTETAWVHKGMLITAKEFNDSLIKE